MPRGFNIDDADQFIESEQFKSIYDSIKNLNSPTEPPVKEGALWIDHNTGELKQCTNGQWTNLYDKKFQITEHIIDSTMPDVVSAVGGELWIDPNTNVLNYFNGSGFGPVKAVSADIDFNTTFSDFCILGPMSPLENISYIGNLDNAESKFLIPNANIDKVFLNNGLDNTYTKLSASTIKYNYSAITDKEVTAVHVLPDRLLKIDKRIFKIDRYFDDAAETWPIANRYIDMPNLNTEFYGFKNGKGFLLINSDTGDYKSYKQGVVLSTNAAKNYDFIVALHYVFGQAKERGYCNIANINIVEPKRVIYIGDVNEPMVLFVNGVATYESLGAFTYSKDTGFITINADLEVQFNVTILTFPSKKEGIVSNPVDDGTNVTITIPNVPIYNKPLLFFNGLALSEDLGQFVYDRVNNCIIVTLGASGTVDMATIQTNGIPYCIVETLDSLKGCDVYAKSGTVENTSTIGIPYTSGPNTEEIVNGVLVKYDLPYDIEGERIVSPVIFVSGLCIPQEQVIEHDNNLLLINNLAAGMKYIFCRNIAYVNAEDGTLTNNRIIYDGLSKDITIPFGIINDGIVYADSNLILDPTFAVSDITPDRLNINEIKKINDAWVCYNNGLASITDNNLINLLDESINQYVRTSRAMCISASNAFDKITCYGYKLGNAIEYPLKTMQFTTTDDSNVYNLYYKHSYTQETNSISLWSNGIRQYDCVEENPNTAEYLQSIDGTGQYIIERPEGNEKQSCTKIYLDYRNKIQGVDNIFKSGIALMPGNLRLYIGGLRQPRETFTLIDPYTIKINGNVVGGSSDFEIDANGVYLKPEMTLVNNNLDVKYVPITNFDSILIEIRNDYKLRECTVGIRERGQNVLSLYEDSLPDDLFDAEDLLTIYVDGLLFDCRPLSDDERNNKCIYLINKSFGDGNYLIEPDKDFITLEWR